MCADRAAIPRLEATTTISAALDALTRMFAGAGIDTPRLDARHLLCAATGLSPEAIVLNPDRSLTVSEAASLTTFAARRTAREPVSRILGRRHFYGRPFEVTSATLDPRPDTETVVGLALSLVRRGKLPASGLRILDIGTGTGAIVLTLLAELPDATGIGSDLSADALAVARRNSQALGVADRVEWHQSSVFEGIGEAFDMIVSNPPYIPLADRADLDPEVSQYDPGMALFAGCDGLNVIRAIVSGAADRCRPGGWCIVEFGAGQWPKIAELLGNQGGAVEPCDRLELGVDLGGHLRCVAWQPQL